MWVSDFPFACAETAVDRAHVVDIKECTVWVAMRDVGYLAIVLLVEWVFYTGANQFLRIGDDLLPDRVAGFFYKAEIIWVDTDRKFFVDAPHFFEVNIECGGEFFGRIDSISDEPFPFFHVRNRPFKWFVYRREITLMACSS